jgi:hypothetical protein
LLFQTFDDKDNCVGVYVADELHFGYVPDGLSRTWSWTPYLESGVDYAHIWAQGKTLDEVCPSQYREEWERVNERLLAYYSSFRLAKVDLTQNCFFDLVPQGFLKDHSAIKNKITQWVFDNHTRPVNHNFMVAAHEAVNEINGYKVNLDVAQLRREKYNDKGKAFLNSLSKHSMITHYRVYGSATGRLTTSKTSFPILRLNKEYRPYVRPNNDWFLELDINAADLRSLFYILGKDQPQIDIHDWNIQNIFDRHTTRDMAKRLMFSWLYDLDKRNDHLEAAYGRDKILRDFWKDGTVTNPFGRTIEVERENAISYLIQSTTADYVMSRIIAINELLKNKKSRIAFTIHDSIVIDMDWEERGVVKDVLSIMREDGFVTSCMTGKDFGNLKELPL